MNRSPDHAMPRELISERGKNRLAVRADAQTEAALLEVLESFCSGFAARDADGVVQLFAPDADVVMVTSEESLLRGPDEVRAFLHRYAQGTTRYSWTWDRRDVSAAGTVGWVLAEGTETDPLWLVFREQRWTPSASPSNPIESRLADLRT
jgi:ketosteroid isomerase-like protein